MTAMVTDAQIQASMSQITAAMAACDSAVTANAGAMQETDVTAWRGIYAAFHNWMVPLKSCIADDFPSIHTECLPYYDLSNHWAQAQAQIDAYTQDVAQYQALVKAANPNFNGPPIPTPPKPVKTFDWTSPSTWPSWAQWSGAGVAVAVGVTIVAKVKQIL